MWRRVIKAFCRRLGYEIVNPINFDIKRKIETKPSPFLGHWPQICFMHIQKTAGTTLHRFFHSLFQNGNSFFAEGPAPFDTLSANDFNNYDFICGHFSYYQALRFKRDKILITFLRNPIDRVASMYWYCRNWNGIIDDHSKEIINIARTYDFWEFLQLDHPQVRSITNNHQAYCFASDWRFRPYANDFWIKDAALSIFDQFAFVGLTERLEESLQLLCQQFGWPAPAPLPRVNVTPNRKSVEELSQRERDLITELNPYDIALYEHAQKDFENRLATVLPMAKTNHQLVKTTAPDPGLAKAG